MGKPLAGKALFEAEEGMPVPYKGGTFMLLPRLVSIPEIGERLWSEFYNAAFDQSFDEMTVPREQRKTCIQCGRMQEADGTLSCGH